MGYGMLIAVYMGDKPAFDAFLTYVSAHLSNGLMGWHIDPNGNTLDPHSATDADQDIAWALIMADKQWGGGNYLSTAKSMLSQIKSSEISGNLPTEGDFSGATVKYPDYARPDYGATFAAVSGDSSWSSVASAEYSQFQSQQNKSTGLVPDTNGGSTVSSEGSRTPLHIGIDYCWHGTSSASSLLSPMVKTFVSLAGSSYPGNLALSLTVSNGSATTPTSPAGDIIGGPAAVAAMYDASNASFVTSSYKWLASFITVATGAGIYGTHGDYFGSSLAMQAFLVMDGDFIDYTSP